MNSMNLMKLYSSIQKTMLSKLQENDSITHSIAKGSASENDWLQWLKTYLPSRYKVDKAFVIDSKGEISDEIDIVIYDAHYSPMIFNEKGVKYITAESVYAVFEVKQNLNKEHIEYAQKKLESVRKLYRTSAKVKYSTGWKDGKEPEQIIGGLLTTSCDWIKEIKENVCKHNNNSVLEMICCIENGSYIYNEGRIEEFVKDEALVAFYFELLKVLQSLGTVTAIDFNEYMNCIKKDR